MCETQEAQIEELNERFANLVEATVLYYLQLDDHEEQANKDRTAVEDLTTRVQKQKDDTAAQLQDLPTFQEVADIIAKEHKAREEAITQALEQLKTTVASNLTPATDRISKIHKALDARQTQSDVLAFKVK